MKSISTINPAITENTECSIIEARTKYVNFKVCRFITMLHFVSSFSNTLANDPSKEKYKRAPASTALA